jgi:predicted oxidoreductase
LQELAAKNDVGVDAVAIAWLLADPAKICPVLGTNSLARIAKISDAANVEISR